ncbi:hypothetical protein BU16DRAFT_90487 [Lophium mytilinum]|uniref:Uncharacterized protein n=1 Tax=Lophium mytilinum TaxID=390894 RepID=A0A6A6QL55_9PEZI|nr:hypothetical protein BU16DRAFT_90487 [Lophium mytilinum]
MIRVGGGQGVSERDTWSIGSPASFPAFPTTNTRLVRPAAVRDVQIPASGAVVGRLWFHTTRPVACGVMQIERRFVLYRKPKHCKWYVFSENDKSPDVETLPRQEGGCCCQLAWTCAWVAGRAMWVLWKVSCGGYASDGSTVCESFARGGRVLGFRRLPASHGIRWGLRLVLVVVSGDAVRGA